MVFGPPDRHDRPQDDKPNPRQNAPYSLLRSARTTLRDCSRLDRRRLGKIASFACFCARLAQLCGIASRLDRRRLGKIASFACFCARLALSLASNSIRTQMKTLTFISLMTTSVACLGSCTNPAASDAQQPWIVDRFDDIKVIRYEVPRFERLPLPSCLFGRKS